MAIAAEIKGTQVGVGDTVKVQLLLVESGKTRLQTFEGVVIGIKGREENRSFIVRRIAVGNIGVERIWPINSPWLKSVQVLKKGNPRRAKLGYLRDRRGGEALKVRERTAKKTQPKTKRATSRKRSSKTAKK